jgi:hypothetical protein
MAVEGRRMRRIQADIFIEIEGGNPAKIQSVLSVHLDQELIEQERCFSRGKSQDRVRLASDMPGDDPGSQEARLPQIRLDNDFHGAHYSRVGLRGKLLTGLFSRGPFPSPGRLEGGFGFSTGLVSSYFLW